jgi:hypothetical protein
LFGELLPRSAWRGSLEYATIMYITNDAAMRMSTETSRRLRIKLAI